MTQNRLLYLTIDNFIDYDKETCFKTCLKATLLRKINDWCYRMMEVSAFIHNRSYTISGSKTVRKAQKCQLVSKFYDGGFAG